MSERISWTNGRFATQHGSVAGLSLFTINYTTERGAAKPWLLRSTLPGFDTATWSCTGESECRAAAEKLLGQFVDHIGATFKENVDVHAE